ncbi:LOW QUALITY PROTEIN: hypothetical protein HZS_3392 [Henneguya salminicola]|nr:LOW QUALITY PROTEIN: hypothetical protein HZS_3392 [Henneguya salminicola]
MIAVFGFIQEDNFNVAYEAFENINKVEEQFRELLNYYEETFIERHYLVALSLYFAFDYGICERTEKKSVELIIKSKPLQKELNIVDIKNNTLHMKTTPKIYVCLQTINLVYGKT